MKLIISDEHSVLILHNDNVNSIAKGSMEGGNILHFWLKTQHYIWWVGICLMYSATISNLFDTWWAGFPANLKMMNS